MNVEQALASARALGLARLDAALLLGHHLQRRREWLIAHPLEPVEALAFEAFQAACRRCADGVPVAYLTGRREFMGLELPGEHRCAGAAPRNRDPRPVGDRAAARHADRAPSPE